MSGVARQSLLNLLVDDDIDLNATLRRPFDDLVESPFLIEVGRSAKEELRGQPPIFNVNGFFGVLDAY